MAEARELVITRVGVHGDGVGEVDGRTVFVPYALPGERLRATFDGDHGRLTEVLEPSPDRVAPVCRHFSVCGGCALQHMSSDSYVVWKIDQVRSAFAARGIAVNVSPLMQPSGFRRRATLSYVRAGDDAVIGFNEAQSHTTVAIAECPVLDPVIVSALPGLKRLMLDALQSVKSARLAVTLADNGLDIVIDDVESRIDVATRSALAAYAHRAGYVRLAIGEEIICELGTPAVRFGGVDVPVPPGGFLQAVKAAEDVLADLVVQNANKAKRVADLFCGAGAFTFALARKAEIAAFDGDASAIGALRAGKRHATGLKPVVATVRDLFREPLSARELDQFDAVVLDPPRAGAEAQARAIAKSKLSKVVAVSCNPATLARDARHLIDGGYEIELVQPVDQFRYTPHIEVVAVFSRKVQRARRRAT